MTTIEVRSMIGATQRRTDADTQALSVSAKDRDDVVARVAVANGDAIAEAASAARVAQRAWREVPAPQRGRLLIKVARAAEDNQERLAQLVTREIGKPINQARFEVGEFASMFHYYGSALLRPDGAMLSSEHRRAQLFAFREPLGVCALITPLNYPVAVPVWGLAPALAAGNALVWKPDVEAAAIANSVLEILRSSGVPDGVVNVVYAAPEQTYSGLDAALKLGALDQLLFVGRTDNGRKLGALCGAALISPSLQLAGRNPLVLARDGDMDGAVDAVRFSSFGVNQGCTAIRIAIVPSERRSEFVTKLDVVVSAAAIGDPSADVLYGPMFSERYAHLFEEALGSIGDHHRTHGSTGIGRVSSRNPRVGFVGDPSAGLYYHPTIVDGVAPGELLFDRETLGPLVSVVPYDSFEEALDLANQAASGLLASVFTRDAATALEFRERVRVGVVAVNRPTSLAGETRVPMGGNGEAGNNTRLAGPWALDSFLRWQSVSWLYGEPANT